MYAIFDISTKQIVCVDVSMRTPKMAWDYFRANAWAQMEQKYGLPDWSTGQHRQVFECRLVGTRTPSTRALGHSLQTFNAGAQIRGQCTCGAWTKYAGTVDGAAEAYRKHLEDIGVDLTPRAAEHLSVSDRVEKSLNKFKEEGGERKTFRLPKPAIEELDRMVNQENYRDHTAAVSAVLIERSRPALAENKALHARHIDNPVVMDTVEEGVRLLCRELDSLFPGEAADGGRGVSSNFQGLLVEHVRAMLLGSNQARRSHHTHLPVLLADDNVFGQPFDLPAEPGAGYVVVNPTANTVLSADSKRFVPAYRGREGEGQYARWMPLFDRDIGGVLPYDARRHDYTGHQLHFANEPDILFSTHEAATLAALDALQACEESPASLPLVIAAAAYEGESDSFVFLPLSRAN